MGINKFLFCMDVDLDFRTFYIIFGIQRQSSNYQLFRTDSFSPSGTDSSYLLFQSLTPETRFLHGQITYCAAY
jgi:hypothetical protein